jgi:hypothetical protein
MADNLFNLNNPEFWGILIRFLINLVFLFILIKVVYFRYNKKKTYLFSFFLMGIVIFFVGAMLKTVFESWTNVGMAIGLFAIFTILRLRTRNFTIKDMAYIFTTIAISSINSFKWSGFPLLGVLIFNLMIISTAFILEEYMYKIKDRKQSIIYNNLELLKPDNNRKLLKDLSSRTGKDILSIKVRRIDFKREEAILDIFYNE